MSSRDSVGGGLPGLVGWAAPPKRTNFAVLITTRTSLLPCPAGDAAVAAEAVKVARPAVAADGERRAVPVASDDLGVVGDAVAVPIEEHDVTRFGLPAAAGRAVRTAVIDGVRAVGEAGPATRLHRWE